MKGINVVVMVLVLLVLPACGPKAKVVSSWVDPAINGYAADNVLVIGLSRSEAGTNLWENVFVDNLAGIGTHAVASHTVMGKVPEPDREAIEAAIRKAKASSVLITHVVDVTSKTYTHPGTVHFEPSGFYGGLYGYYGRTYRTVYTPPVDSTRTVVRLESNLYDVATAALVWSAQSEILNPNLLKTDYNRVAEVLLTNMKKNGIFQ